MEPILHMMLRNAGLDSDAIAEISAHVDEYTAEQVAMFKSANEEWQRRCSELETQLALLRTLLIQVGDKLDQEFGPPDPSQNAKERTS